MIRDKDRTLLKRYRHIIAALIAYSIGYFTPLAALRAIQDYKNNQPNFCEWYLDIAWKRGTNTDDDFIAIRFQACSFRRRPKYSRSRISRRKLVLIVISGAVLCGQSLLFIFGGDHLWLFPFSFLSARSK